MKISEILKELIEENRIKLLLEVFNKIGELPDNLKQEGNTFYFTNDGIDYYVEFKEFKDLSNSRTLSDELKNLIKKFDNKFVVDFGIIENGLKNSTINLNNFKGIKILNYIISIIDMFIKNNNVNVITYHIEDTKRLNIYNEIFNRLFSENFTKFGEEKIFRNIIYIRTKLL